MRDLLTDPSSSEQCWVNGRRPAELAKQTIQLAGKPETALKIKRKSKTKQKSTFRDSHGKSPSRNRSEKSHQRRQRLSSHSSSIMVVPMRFTHLLLHSNHSVITGIRSPSWRGAGGGGGEMGEEGPGSGRSRPGRWQRRGGWTAGGKSTGG